MSGKQGSGNYVVVAEHRVASCQPVGTDVLWSDPHIRQCLNLARKTVEPLCRACEAALASENPQELGVVLMGAVKGSTLYLSVALEYQCEERDAEDMAERLRDVVRNAAQALMLINESTDPSRVALEAGMGSVIRASDDVVLAPSVVVDAVNRIRESAKRSPDRRLDAQISIGCDETLQIHYSDASSQYVDEEDIYVSDVTIDHVRDADETAMVSLVVPPEAMVNTDLRMRFASKEVRESLLNAQLHWCEVGVRWRATKKLKNGLPIIVGGEILAVHEPAQRSLM